MYGVWDEPSNTMHRCIEYGMGTIFSRLYSSSVTRNDALKICKLASFWGIHVAVVFLRQFSGNDPQVTSRLGFPNALQGGFSGFVMGWVCLN